MTMNVAKCRAVRPRIPSAMCSNGSCLWSPREFRAVRLGNGADLRAAPPQPDRFVTRRRRDADDAPSDIVAGKAGFQKADLMDYGSLYGMGSYFGAGLHRLRTGAPGRADRGQSRASPVGKRVRALPAEQQAAVRERCSSSSRASI